MSQKGIPLTKWPKLAAKMNQLLVGYPPVHPIFFSLGFIKDSDPERVKLD